MRQLTVLMSHDFCLVHPTSTKIYTYSHTLSLHDALPICLRGRRPLPPRHAGERAVCPAVVQRDRRPECRVAGTRRDLAAGARALHPVGIRSEEHTSELQSLMRTSYAGFCLNKKTNITVLN